MHLGEGIWEEASGRRHLGGSIWEEASGRRHLDEASARKHMGGGIWGEGIWEEVGEIPKRHPRRPKRTQKDATK